MPVTSVWPKPAGRVVHGESSTVIMAFHSGLPPNDRRLVRSNRPSALISRICSMVGGMMNAPVQRSASMTRHSSSASTRGVKTLVPPNR